MKFLQVRSGTLVRDRILIAPPTKIRFWFILGQKVSFDKPAGAMAANNSITRNDLRTRNSRYFQEGKDFPLKCRVVEGEITRATRDIRT